LLHWEREARHVNAEKKLVPKGVKKKVSSKSKAGKTECTSKPEPAPKSSRQAPKQEKLESGDDFI